MKTSKLRNFTAGFAKIFEVLLWIGDGLMAVCLVAALIFSKNLIEFIDTEDFINYFSASFIEVADINRSNIIPIIICGALLAITIFTLTAIMLRNVNLIFKTTNQESPFASVNVKRIQQIGYIAISIPIIKIVGNIIIGIFVKEATIGVELSEVLFGLIILCLSQYFAYGASLEKDVNGLV